MKSLLENNIPISNREIILKFLLNYNFIQIKKSSQDSLITSYEHIIYLNQKYKETDEIINIKCNRINKFISIISIFKNEFENINTLINYNEDHIKIKNYMKTLIISSKLLIDYFYNSFKNLDDYPSFLIPMIYKLIREFLFKYNFFRLILSNISLNQKFDLNIQFTVDNSFLNKLSEIFNFFDFDKIYNIYIDRLFNLNEIYDFYKDFKISNHFYKHD